MAVKEKSYKEMSRKERKIAIAKDVIANIHAQKLEVLTGYGYVVHKWDAEILRHVDVLKKYFSSQEIAEAVKPQCYVCARGAMMICKIAKFNNYEFDENYIGQETTTEALKDAFTAKELFQIESAFELWDDKNYDDKSYSLPEKVIDAWAKIEDPRDRLLAIMQNIIDHDGTFKPKVEYEVYWK